MKTFSTRLKQARRARGWTQAELARRSGLCRCNIALYESGRRVPEIRVLSLFCETLKLPFAPLAELLRARHKKVVAKAKRKK